MDEQRDIKHSSDPMHAPRAFPEPPEPFGPTADAEVLARDLVALRTVAPDTGIGAAILRRLDTSGAPGLHAAGLGGRFAPKAMRAPPLQLTVSPYAPPQRQISAARQGAPMWRPPAAPAPAARPPAAAHEPTAEQAAAVPPAPPPRAAASDPDELPADLKRLLALHREKGRI